MSTTYALGDTFDTGALSFSVDTVGTDTFEELMQCPSCGARDAKGATLIRTWSATTLGMAMRAAAATAEMTVTVTRTSGVASSLAWTTLPAFLTTPAVPTTTVTQIACRCAIL